MSYQVIAHGGHDERIKLRLDDSVFLLDTHIPSRLLKGFDENRDGKLSAAEFRQSTNEIKTWISNNIIVRSADGGRLLPTYFDVPVSEGDMSHDDGKVNFIRIIQRYDRPESGGLTLGISMYGNESKSVLLHRDGKISRKVFPSGTIKMALK